MRSRTMVSSCFGAASFKIQKTRIYPLGKKENAKPMQFPDASNVPVNMLFPTDGSAFDMLARFINHEYVDLADMWMRGVTATLGIVKGKPFSSDANMRVTLGLRMLHSA